MLVFKKVSNLQKHLNKVRKSGQKIGFAPTMGALHQGHLSLIKQSKAQNDCTVCSIFVNPTQFDDKKDLKKYPRTTSQDTALLESVETEVLFLPSVEEVYPSNQVVRNDFDFGQLAKVMEGAFREGHFEGMAQVVNRLLEIVQPHNLYMGQKDFQQLTIVRDLLRQTNSSTNLVMCPIIREQDGLAMSSRNVRLSPENRQKAVVLSQTLLKVKERLGQASIAELESFAMTHLKLPDFRPEYFQIVDGVSLQAIENLEDSKLIVACVACWAGDIRLIDNMIFKNNLK